MHPASTLTHLQALGLRVEATAEALEALSAEEPRVTEQEAWFVLGIPSGVRITLEDLRITPQGLRIFDHDWYKDEAFYRRPTEPGWRLISRDLVGGAAAGADASGLEVSLPSAVDVVLMLYLVKMSEGRFLLSRTHTWCSDVDSKGRRVTVGAFNPKGVFLSAHHAGYRSRALGTLMVSRPLPGSAD